MNIFRLDDDPKICARYHADRHVIKMPLEYLCFLRTYKHPLTVWAHESKENFEWLVELGINVCTEYLFRFGQLHPLTKDFTTIQTPQLPSGSTIQPYINEGIYVESTGNIVKDYRDLYVRVKKDLCRWSFRLPPKWFTSDAEKYFIGDQAFLQKLLRS